MKLTIDIKNSAVDKVMYILNNLKSDVKIISSNENPLEIGTINETDEDYKIVLNGRKEIEKNPDNFKDLNSVNWD